MVSKEYEKRHIYKGEKRFLYNIQAIDNVASIMEYGLLSHNMAEENEHIDVSNPWVQEIRDIRKVTDNSYVHDYANLYFNSHNAMLYKVLEDVDYEEICILVFNLKVLDIPGTYVSDRNAATKGVTFYQSRMGYKELDFKVINYKTPIYNGRVIRNSKEVMMAEVLVPDVIPSEYIKCAYVYNEEARKKLKKQGFSKKIKIKREEFVF